MPMPDFDVPKAAPTAVKGENQARSINPTVQALYALLNIIYKTAA